MAERKTKTDHTGKRIKNFTVVEKTERKKSRPDGRNFYIYICKCDCNTIFEAVSAQFEYMTGCYTCSKKNHYEKSAESQRKTKSKKLYRTTELSKLYPESYGGKKGSYANYIINWIKGTAKKRNLSWDIKDIEVFELIQKPCFYCNKNVKIPETRNGLDRIDNKKGYSIDNVVPCCFNCNISKRDMTIDEFKIFITNIYKNWASK